MVRILQQALLSQRDHGVGIAKATVQLHVDVLEDVLLFPAAAAHAVDVPIGIA